MAESWREVVVAVALLVTVGSGPAAAQPAPPAPAPLTVALETDGIEEGRPGEVKLVVTAGAAVALVELGVGLRRPGGWAQETSRTMMSSQHAVSLQPVDDALVTLELSAHDDPGVEARAPLPPVRAQLGEQSYVRLPVLAPGETFEVPLEWVPVAGAYEVWGWVEVRRLPGPDRELDAARVYAPEPAERWSPNPAGPDPGGSRRVGFTVELTRWRPWRGGAPPSVLLCEQDALEALTRERAERKQPGEVPPAGFSLAVARERAGLARGKGKGVRLADGAWVIEGRAQWWYVPAEGAAVTGPGQAYLLALGLARRGVMSFVLDMRTNAALGEALADGGFVGTVRGGGGWVEVRTEQARAFFELVAAHGARLTSTGVE